MAKRQEHGGATSKIPAKEREASNFDGETAGTSWDTPEKEGACHSHEGGAPHHSKSGHHPAVAPASIGNNGCHLIHWAK